MKKSLQLLFLLLGCGIRTGIAGNSDTVRTAPCPSCNEYLYWTGEEDNDFFNERNWRQARQHPSRPAIPSPGTVKPASVKPACLPGANKKTYQICLGTHTPQDRHPASGAIDPGQPISYNLYASGGQIKVNGPVIFDFPDKGLTLVNVGLEVLDVIESGVISLDASATVHLRIDHPLGPSATVNLLDAESWIYFHQRDPDELLGSDIANIWVHHSEGIPDSTLSISQYYQAGAIARIKSPEYTPLTIFSGANFSQDSTALRTSIIYTGNTIPGGMNNAAESFRLKRGYMATFANNDDGTGKSKVYIASESDLLIDRLPPALSGDVSFIRVLPWNWVTKKGTGGFEDRLTAGWFYNWGNGETARPNYAYVPMAWGAGATSEATLRDIIAKDKATHLLGFNESDNCNGQSGQYNNLCQPDVAVAYYERLMKTGLRLGSPAPRENGPNTWLRDFLRIARERDVRFDFVAVHWYDWGSNPRNSPYANPQQVFKRFKNYLNSVYAIYQLPIWITEFNANPNRDNTVNTAFLQLALPWLEETGFVERYAYFEPNANNASNNVQSSYYFDERGNITNIGKIYRDHVSTPSIPQATYAAPNNLNLEGLEPETFFMEAEDAELIGTASVVNCAHASNGAVVNSRKSLANGIRFNDVNVTTSGKYILEMAYVTKNARNARLFVNGVHQETLTFQSSGGWCYEDGVPATMSVAVNLQQGSNSLEFKPAGTDAPFLDRISVVKAPGEQNFALFSMTAMTDESAALTNDRPLLYPNPVEVHSAMRLSIPGDPGQQEVTLKIFNMSGVSVYESIELLDNGEVHIHPPLHSGVYYITIRCGDQFSTEKLMVK